MEDSSLEDSSLKDSSLDDSNLDDSKKNTDNSLSNIEFIIKNAYLNQYNQLLKNTLDTNKFTNIIDDLELNKNDLNNSTSNLLNFVINIINNLGLHDDKLQKKITNKLINNNKFYFNANLDLDSDSDLDSNSGLKSNDIQIKYYDEMYENKIELYENNSFNLKKILKKIDELKI